MPALDVDGVRVNFPFEPYSCQVTYMEKVIKCLKEVIRMKIWGVTGVQFEGDFGKIIALGVENSPCIGLREKWESLPDQNTLDKL